MCTVAGRSQRGLLEKGRQDRASEGTLPGDRQGMGRQAGKGSGEDGGRDWQERKRKSHLQAGGEDTTLGPRLRSHWTGAGSAPEEDGAGHRHPSWAPAAAFPALGYEMPGANGHHSRQGRRRRRHVTRFIHSPFVSSSSARRARQTAAVGRWRDPAVRAQ